MILYRVEVQEINGRVSRTGQLSYRLARILADSLQETTEPGTIISVILA